MLQTSLQQIYLSENTLVNVTQNYLAYFDTPQADVKCGAFPCTGLSNVLIKDSDGTFIGSMGTIVPNNPGIISNATCSFISTMNGYICADSELILLQFESNDNDKWTRVISPVNISSSNGYSNIINAFKAHTYTTSTNYQRLARFPALVRRGQSYSVSFSGTLPDSLSFHLESMVTSDYVIIRVPINDAKVVSVVNAITNRVIPPTSTQFGAAATILSTDDCGTNYYEKDGYTINFMVTACPKCQLYLKKTNLIAVNIRYDMSQTDFFAQGGAATFIDKVASVLGISHTRIRVVSMTSGSVILNTQILSDYQESGQNTAATAQLANYTSTLDSAVSSGVMNVYNNATILNYETKMALMNEPTTTKSTGSGPDVITSKSPLLYGLIIGGVVLAATLGAFFIYRYRKVVKKNNALSKIVPDTNIKPKQPRLSGYLPAQTGTPAQTPRNELPVVFDLKRKDAEALNAHGRIETHEDLLQSTYGDDKSQVRGLKPIAVNNQFMTIENVDDSIPNSDDRLERNLSPIKVGKRFKKGGANDDDLEHIDL